MAEAEEGMDEEEKERVEAEEAWREALLENMLLPLCGFLRVVVGFKFRLS